MSGQNHVVTVEYVALSSAGRKIDDGVMAGPASSAGREMPGRGPFARCFVVLVHENWDNSNVLCCFSSCVRRTSEIGFKV